MSCTCEVRPGRLCLACRADQIRVRRIALKLAALGAEADRIQPLLLDAAIRHMQIALDCLEQASVQASSCGNVEAHECAEKSMQELGSAVNWARQSKAEGAS